MMRVSILYRIDTIDDNLNRDESISDYKDWNDVFREVYSLELKSCTVLEIKRVDVF